MEQVFSPIAPIKSALFVDFDNIYIGLSKSDPQAAERFAADPARWLAWLEKGCLDRSSNQARPRSVLIRRCYPNPDAGFRRYRSFFTSAAFSVIDCPSMTRAGKNSADIYMVMDILDMLNHKTHFDEFIIFSGDSDFMPVLLRLRAYDRRTTTLAIDFMPPAYKAACDLVISEEEFIEDALGISNEGNCSSARARVPVAVLKAMAARVYAAARDTGEVAGADLPDILKDFREFRDSNNWLGYGTSQRLAEALVCSEPRLQVVRLNPMMYTLVMKTRVIPAEPLPEEAYVPPAAAPVEKPADELKVLAAKLPPARRTAAKSVDGKTVVARTPASKLPEAKPPAAKRTGRAARADRQAPVAAGSETAEPADKTDLEGLRVKVIAMVREMVAGSQSPVLLARASQFVVSKLGAQVLQTQWAGAGTFKRLLQLAGDLGLEITTQPEPGYIFDPSRHERPVPREQAQVAETSSEEGSDEEVSTQAASILAAEDEAVPHSTGTETEPYPSQSAPAKAEAEPFTLESLAETSQEPFGRSAYAGPPYEETPYDGEDEEEESAEDYEESLPSLEEFSRRVRLVTGAPDLSPQQYALVFRGIVAELQEIAAGEKTYNTYQSSEAISDWCAEQGSPVTRGDVVLILKGIIFQDGVRFSKRPGSYTAEELGSIVRKNIKALCRRSRMEISEYEERLLDEWILGGLEENAAAFSEETREESEPRE